MYKGLVTDVEGILVPEFAFWDGLAKRAGIEQFLYKQLKKYRRGECSFKESLDAVFSKVHEEGIRRDEIEGLSSSIPYTNGAEFFLNYVREAYKGNVSLLSSCMDSLVYRIADNHNLGSRCNIIPEDFDETGNVLCIVDNNTKGEHFSELCDSMNLKPSETIALGNGPEDISMFERAGFVIAWNPDAAVKKEVGKMKRKLVIENVNSLTYLVPKLPS